MSDLVQEPPGPIGFEAISGGRRSDANRRGRSRAVRRSRPEDDPMWLEELCETGKAAWVERERAWVAQPEDVVSALVRDGFEECKREVARSRRDRDPLGGVWQGLNRQTGSVASAVWINRANARRAIVFLEVDGEPLVGAGDG